MQGLGLRSLPKGWIADDCFIVERFGLIEVIRESETVVVSDFAMCLASGEEKEASAVIDRLEPLLTTPTKVGYTRAAGVWIDHKGVG
jgi:hypothetical protein